MPRKSSVPSKAFAALTGRFEERQTVPDRVAASLRESIMTGSISPGDAIVESKLARQLGVGQPTVREALKTLEGEGLITRQQNRGCSVTKLSTGEMDMIFRLRMELEPLAVSLARERWSEAKAQRLKGAFKLLETAARAEDVRAYFLADLEFHRTLWALSDNPFLERALYQITAPQFAFEVMMLFHRPGFSFKQNLKDHQRILDAVLSASPEEAVRVTRQAIVGFRETDRGIIY